MPGMEEAEDYESCAFSLTCPEDGAELGDGVVDDGDLFLFYVGRRAAAHASNGPCCRVPASPWRLHGPARQ